MKYVDYDGLLYFWQKLKAFFATATDLETLDEKVDGIIAEGGEPNVIETVKVDGTALPVASKAVNIDLSGKANLASPEFTGTPKAPTATTGTNTTQIATTAFVKAQITADIANKANIASPEFTGTPKAPTATTGTNTTQIATTAFVKAQIATDIASKADSATTLAGYGIADAYTKDETDSAISTAIGQLDTGVTSVNSKTGAVTLGASDVGAYTTTEVDDALALKANLASPTFTGTPKAPTAATGTNTTQIATTAFVKAQIAADIAGKANSATTLDGYGITNAYTKIETDTQISNAISGVTSFEFEVVSTLPATGVKGKIYLVAATGGSGQNVYEEFIWITNKYERLGTTDIDLSGYVLSSDLVRITNSEIDTICAA